MLTYTGMISKNIENPPSEVFLDNYIKVRIPNLHGPKTVEDYSDINISENKQIWVSDENLPWAHVLKPIGTQGTFVASDYFEEDEIVLVQAVNDDLSNLLVLGKLGNFVATSDSQTIEGRKNGTITADSSISSSSNDPAFVNSSSLISIAKSQIGVKDNGNNKVIYNTAYYGREVYGSNYAWCCAFVWWCFQKANLSQYFYGGNKTASCQTLFDYHKKKNESVSNDFKAGDILFFNWTNKNGRAQHVGIAIEDQNGNTIKTVEGNTCGSGNQSSGGQVMEKTRKMSQIIGGYRPGKSTSNEQQCFDYFTKTMGLNTAAACGIMGNIYYESSFKTTTVGDKGTSYGICQWHNGRYDNLKKYCAEQNMDYTQLIPQLKYLNYELTTSYTKVLNSIKSVSNTSEGAASAAETWCRKFEIPANVDNEVNKKRVPKAKEYFTKYNK